MGLEEITDVFYFLGLGITYIGYRISDKHWQRKYKLLQQEKKMMDGFISQSNNYIMSHFYKFGLIQQDPYLLDKFNLYIGDQKMMDEGQKLCNERAKRIREGKEEHGGPNSKTSHN